jgi:hypothetical protein
VACNSKPELQTELPIECAKFDRIRFDRFNCLEDPQLNQFLQPIQKIDSAILANKIQPDTIMRPYLYDTLYIESWAYDHRQFKIRKRKNDSQFTPEIESIQAFYTLTNCNWYYVVEKRRIIPDTLISIQIINFNDQEYVNYIYTQGPEPIRGYSKKSTKTLPILNVPQLVHYYFGTREEVEIYKSN